MKWKNYTGQQKMLVVAAACVIAVGFFVLLEIWGIKLGDEFIGKLIGSAMVVLVVTAVLIAINSNMRDEKKDGDNFFN